MSSRQLEVLYSGELHPFGSVSIILSTPGEITLSDDQKKSLCCPDDPDTRTQYIETFPEFGKASLKIFLLENEND